MGCQQSTTSMPSSTCQGKAITSRITVNGEVINGSSIQVQRTYNSQRQVWNPITVISTVDCAEKATFVITDSQGHFLDNTPYTIPNGASGTITHTLNCAFNPGQYNVKVEAYSSQAGSSTLNQYINVVGSPTITSTHTTTPALPGTRQLDQDPTSSNLLLWILIIIIVLIILWFLWRQRQH